ncbi:hypothetical protein ACJX0J_024197, partial [Zea mays]
LRRVDHDRELRRRRRVAEQRQPVAQAGGVPDHPGRQGCRGQRPAVPLQGFLRRHHGRSRQRIRLPERRTLLRGGAGPLRRPGVHQGRRRAAARQLRPRPAHRLLLQPRLHPGRNGRAV